MATTMETTFKQFASTIEGKFDSFDRFEGNLFVVDFNPWEVYLASFPEGSNPVFKERTEHDCQCCKQFVRNLGNVVSIVNSQRTSVWDVGLHYPYNEVAEALHYEALTSPIKSVFATKETRFGKRRSLSLSENGETLRWDHFEATIPARFHTDSVGSVKGKYETDASVFKRGLEEITREAVVDVLALIEDNSIYRGQEFKKSVEQFRDLQNWYGTCYSMENYIWENAQRPAARIKNTAIGTLLIDLSSGVELEDAVRMFESKTAPANYKRPKSLITPGMIDKAMGFIRERGVEDALKRRHAKLSDVSVTDVLFVNEESKLKMKNSIESLLLEEAVSKPMDLSKAKEISVEKFLSDVLPKCTSLDLQLSNDMLGNFVSLTAPVEDSGRLFKWDNDFAWSYDGGVADSIKQRVKKAGGNVDAKVRVSLGWFNTDDLDIHVYEPGGNHIYFSNKSGKLDVDMNASSLVRDPVENVCWNGKMRSGKYRVEVQNFHKRESVDVGFEMEIVSDAQVISVSYDKPVPDKRTIEVFEFTVDNDVITEIEIINKDLNHSLKQKDKWGVKTNSLVKVNTVMLSPNHWGSNEAGNKHWFFVLDDCINPDPVRGVYNEFLSNEFAEHRKVFEILGDKVKCPFQEEQLSGVGFSSTQKSKATVMTRGAINKPYTIIF